MQVGFIGLGRMGGNMVAKTVAGGHQLVVWNRSAEPVAQATKAGAVAAGSVEELVNKLSSPKIVWVMLPAGEVTEEMLLGKDGLIHLVGKNDIVIDGANSFYKDSQRRWQVFAREKIKFLAIGMSGGVVARERGYALMAGGDKDAYRLLIPFFDSLSAPHGSYDYFGEGGAGHFVKMAHNAIEYGMMQSIAEGFELLDRGPYPQLDLAKVAKVWNQGTIVSSFLVEMAGRALDDNPKLSSIEPFVEDTGEGRWAVQSAVEHAVPFTAITSALFARFASRSKDSFALKLLSAIRYQFGAHAIKSKK